MSELKEENSFDKTREYLANERTFLAWIRTSIAFMGFGFVIMKFSLFLKQFSILLGMEIQVTKGFSATAGILMIALGIIFALLAFFQYKKTEKQLANHNFVPSSWLSLFITLVMMVVGIFLIIYLISYV